jgi:NAD(P)-dependent dehydrogenase (short-subunit alcohol dehydrogenase family)
MDRMRGKSALVTGAAKGLGEATAALLAREGAHSKRSIRSAESVSRMT